MCRDWGSSRICSRCCERFAPAVPRCARCGLGLAAAAPACGECLREPPPFERSFCGADYAFPWDSLITQFKFQGQVELAGALAQRLLAVLPEAPADDSASMARTLVVPVPLAPGRLAQRGYNQAWEVARRVAAARRLPSLADALLRSVDATPQAGLGRAERQRNLRAAFSIDPARRAALQGRRVALVDDVVTTGATAREAAAALLRAGAAAVEVWAVARTPSPATKD